MLHDIRICITDERLLFFLTVEAFFFVFILRVFFLFFIVIDVAVAFIHVAFINDVRVNALYLLTLLMLMILILLILGGLRRRERSGAPWLHLIIRLLRILILLVVLHGVRELILGWLLDEAHHVLLCIRRTSHSSITEGRLLLLAQDRLLFLFLRNKVMHCDDRLPRI